MRRSFILRWGKAFEMARSCTLAQFFPPELSLHYLKAALIPLEQTLAMAAGGILIAVMLGMIAGNLGGRGTSRAIAGSTPRSRAFDPFPDLTLAILCVVVVGIGPGGGNARARHLLQRGDREDFLRSVSLRRSRAQPRPCAPPAPAVFRWRCSACCRCAPRTS